MSNWLTGDRKVDQVCQNDTEERNQQVSLMADINTLAQYAPSTYFEWFFRQRKARWRLRKRRRF
jgi:hypothetical protein